MKKYKILMFLIVIVILTGCSKSPFENDKDTYWIDTKAVESKDRLISRGNRTESDATFYQFDSEFSQTAYQFLGSGKCKQFTLGGTEYFNSSDYDTSVINLYPTYDNNKDYYLISDTNIIKTNGIWTSNQVNCTYETKDDEITIKVKSCDPSVGAEEKTIKGNYKLEDNKLKIVWNKCEYRHGTISYPNGKVSVAWEEKAYQNEKIDNIEVEYTNSKIINDIESITYRQDIKSYMYYDIKSMEYDIGEHEQNGAFYDSMTFGLWARSVLSENNSSLDVDDFLFVNQWNNIDNRYLINGYNTTMGEFKKSIYDYQMSDGNQIRLFIPYKKYNNDEFKDNIAKVYGTSKDNVKVYACYSENEQSGGRQCYEYDNPLNEETDNYMDVVVELQDRTVPSYGFDGFFSIEIKKDEIKQRIDEAKSKSDSLWKTYTNWSKYNFDDECLYGKDS